MFNINIKIYFFKKIFSQNLENIYVNETELVRVIGIYILFCSSLDEIRQMLKWCIKISITSTFSGYSQKWPSNIFSAKIYRTTDAITERDYFIAGHAFYHKL